MQFSFTQKRRDEINKDIDYIGRISKVISSKNKNSFGGWAVSNQAQLNQAQESVLFHFATLATSKSMLENYIPDPRTFLDGLSQVDETGETFVINLDGLYYHIPKRPDYIFSNPKQLKKKIDEIGLEFEQRISALEEELSAIEKLEEIFSAPLNYSEEHLAAFQNESKIKSFNKDFSLNLTEAQFNDCIELYKMDLILSDDKKVKRLFESTFRLYEEKLGKKTIGDEMIRSKSTIKSQSLIKIDELKREVEQRESRIDFLRNTERVGNESKFILWKSDQQNILVDKDMLLHQARVKFSKLNLESDLHEKQIELVKESSPLKGQIFTLDKELQVLNDTFDKRRLDYENHFKARFNENELISIISDQDLSDAKGIESSAIINYREKYEETFTLFEQYLKESPKLKQHNYDLNALILELIPPEIISNKENPAESLLIDIESKLSELHQKIKELSKEEATKIINTVRDIKNIVKRQILFLEQIQALLADFSLATHRKVQLKWSYSTDFDLQWISALESDINELNFEDNLFGERSKVNAHELLEKTFKKYCPSRIDAKAYDILDPFNYYDAEATIVDHTGTLSPGSGGQNYGMLALLCVAKLSIVEGKTKNIFSNIEKGVRVLPIDEVAGLGQNYETLSEIAQQLDYQIFTMTVSANDLDFEEGNQIYYEFIPNARKELSDYNEGVQACFSKNNLIHDLEAYYSEALDSYKLKQ